MNIFSFMEDLQKYLEKELKVLPLKYQERSQAMPIPKQEEPPKQEELSKQEEPPKQEELSKQEEPPKQEELPKPYPSELQQDFAKTRPAQVLIGSMPEHVNKATSTAPFVLIQVMNGFIHNGEHNFNVVLRICICNDETKEAEADLHNLISLLIKSLVILPSNTLSQRYRLLNKSEDESISWERPDEQVYPFLQAHIMTTWSMKGVQNESI